MPEIYEDGLRMVYQGSKAKLVDWLLPLMKPYLDKAPVYYEPFVGGANMICKVPHAVRIGSDSNKYLIALLKKVQEDVTVLPAEIDEDTYTRVKASPGVFEPWFVGMVAFCATFRGIYWGGFARDEGGKRPSQLLNNLRQQAPLLNGIEFRCADYRRIKYSKFSPGTLFYCDIPYKSTSGYDQYFDHDAFYRWCYGVHNAGHTILLSEFWAPSCFEELGNTKRIDTLCCSYEGDKPQEVTERLFVFRG